ncbi:3-phosphoshikimate 1-carboxyvinyltransferase [Clostridium sp. FAM 1755]|uniref:3-phosphoshikimate 1-carboxyvinyltransferase n=1 Tax=Clostridium caseinilyticum TaxID=3350403 RepID=UPI0038F70686
MDLLVKKLKESLKGEYEITGDKSIGHRSLIIGALAKGEYKVYNFPKNLDCMATLESMKKLGVDIKIEGNTLKVNSPGYENFNKKPEVLQGENSGTTVRLMSGVLSGIGAEAKFVGDDSLSCRPMKRIIKPLEKMGAKIESKDNKLPLKFLRHSGLKSIKYNMEVASAQVKSCILLAGLMCDGETTVIEEKCTRDHTERMLKYLDASINIRNIYSNGEEKSIYKKEITIKKSKLNSKDIYVPGDISSAAFLVSAALLQKESNLCIKNVLLNEGRIEYINVLKGMGANIEIEKGNLLNGELVGNIYVKESALKGIIVEKHIIPNIIDEIPVLSVVAAFSEGKTIFKSVEELKFKESDRVKAIIENLNRAGINAMYEKGDLIVEGNKSYIDKYLEIESFKDHRIALAFLILSLKNKKNTLIKDYQCTEISFSNSLSLFSLDYELI